MVDNDDDTDDHCKVTIIWAPQSGTSAEGAIHRVRVPHSWAVRGPTWVWGTSRELPQRSPGQSPGRQRFFSYIVYKTSLETVIFFRDTSLKIGTVPENRRRSVTLDYCYYNAKTVVKPSQKRYTWGLLYANSSYMTAKAIVHHDRSSKDALNRSVFSSAQNARYHDDVPRSMPATCSIEAKFHYASWFEASSKLVRAEIWPII